MFRFVAAKPTHARSRNLAVQPLPALLAAQDNRGEKHDLPFSFRSVQGSLDSPAAIMPVSRQGPPSLITGPGVIDFKLSAASRPKQALLGFSRRGTTRPSALKTTARPGTGISGYAWIFARAAGPRPDYRAAAISNGQYGGSQAGVTLAYSILAESEFELAAFGRLTAALAPVDQEEIALGLRIHPVRDLPVFIHAEQRLKAYSGGDRGTAFYVSGGTGPSDIVGTVALETYGQAGYVVGHSESYFFDGSAILHRPVADTGREKIFLGAGIWTGGQRGTSRVDVGPRADINIPLGSTSTTRLSADWRVRVAGDARPDTGLAITLSAGF